MDKKSQLTLFIIIGILLAVLLAFSLILVVRNTGFDFESESRKASRLSEMRADIKAYIISCGYEAVSTLVDDTGLREETRQLYENRISEEVMICSETIFASLAEQGYSIEAQAASTIVELTDNSILVTVLYPVTVRRNQEIITFDEFTIKLERAVTVYFPDGLVPADTIVQAMNERAYLLLEEGTEITDEDGNPVEYVSLNLVDLHFDGLSNGVVVGNVVYQGLPEGAQFSREVTLVIEIRQHDIPPGYTMNDLKIAWWDKTLRLWRSWPTAIEGNRLVAQITHFTEMAPPICAVSYAYVIPKVMQQRYYPVLEIGELFEESKYWHRGTGGQLVARMPRETYTDFLDIKNAVYQCPANIDCSECLDDSGDFFVEFDGFPSSLICKSTRAACNSTETRTIHPGNSCSEGIGLGDYGFVCNPVGSPSPDGKIDCECNPPAYKDKAFGYCHSCCAGGTLRAESAAGCIASYDFPDQGNACLDNAFVRSTYIPNDFSYLIPYPDTGKLGKLMPGESGARYCVYGIGIENRNRDSLVSGGVVFYITGGERILD
jgi:hypothetical protein